jgi:hypothetical protein
MSEWQPIETAPRHRNILLWWRTCKEPHIGCWDIDEEFERRPKRWLSPEEGWRNKGDQCIPRNQSDCTHWQPLPAPPESTS